MKNKLIIYISLCSLFLFSFLAGSGTVPIVSSHTGSNFTEGLSVANITTNSAVFSYLAGGTQITEHGVVYGKSAQPALGSGNRVTYYIGTAKNVPPTKTFFKVSASRLEASTKYYARAYIKDSSGNIVYGNEVSFTTLRAK